MKPTLVVLAAGMGSRYGGVKQMDGFGPNKEWLLEYSVYDAIQAGFGKVVFILRQEILDDFSSYFEARLPSHIEREYVIQSLDNLPDGFSLPENRQKPWGTAHAVLVTKNAIQNPFAVINADDYYGANAFNQMGKYLTGVDVNSYDFSTVGYMLRNTLSENGSVARGVCNVDEKHNLTNIEEHTKIYRREDGVIVNEGEGSQDTLAENTVVSMNFFGFTPMIFDKMKSYFLDFLEERGQEEKSEFYIPLALQRFLDDDLATIHVMTSEDRWFGVTYAEDKQHVERQLSTMVEDGVYPEKLWV